MGSVCAPTRRALDLKGNCKGTDIDLLPFKEGRCSLLHLAKERREIIVNVFYSALTFFN